MYLPNLLALAPLPASRMIYSPYSASPARPLSLSVPLVDCMSKWIFNAAKQDDDGHEIEVIEVTLETGGVTGLFLLLILSCICPFIWGHLDPAGRHLLQIVTSLPMFTCLAKSLCGPHLQTMVAPGIGSLVGSWFFIPFDGVIPYPAGLYGL